MKETIKDFKPGITDTIKLLLMNIDEKTAKTGKYYVTLTLTDGKNVISGNMFDKKEDDFPFVGKVVEVRLEAKNYNDTCVFNIHSCTLTDENVEKYIPHAPLAAEKMFNDIYSYSEKLGVYSSITLSILEEYKETLLVWTAAKKVHHNIRGGLLYHIYRMLKNAIYLSGCYKTLDKDLLCAGVILHDIGKVKELTCDMLGATDYTISGNLFGHLVLGSEIISEHAKKVELPEKETMLLKHMIISHHGKEEYGAIKKPCIPEAAALYHIDSMDAEMYQFEETRENMESDSMSELVYGLNVRVYNP